MAKKIGLKDIAQHVGVSVALVSYVLNGKEKEARISAAMAEKIRSKAAELNYQPNMIAKSLKSGKTHTIGLIVADISQPFFSGIARIVEDEARKHNYVVIFGSSDEDAGKQQDLINVMVNRLVDAFIIAPAAGSEKQIISISERNIPVILIDRYFPGMDIDSVHIDNFLVAEKGVQKLVSNGRKKIAMLTYDSKLMHMQQRKEGYKSVLKNNSIHFKSAWLLEVPYHYMQTDVWDKMERLLNPLQVNAVFFGTNSLAVTGLKKIVQLGIKVPEELAIISFDESEAFDFFYSPISYVSQSIEDFGKEAVKLAIAKLKGKTKKSSEIIVKAKLIVRESCGNKNKQKN